MPLQPEPVFLESSKIGFRHGFFTRDGGVSEGQWSGLNVTSRTGDSNVLVSKNRQIALSALNLDPKKLVFLDKLGHGSKILAASASAAGLDFDGYDVIVTNDTEISIGLSVADCLPIVVADEVNGVIGVIHAGWRGLVDKVVQKTIALMVIDYKCYPAHMTAVIGPGITVKNYQFGIEASEIFDERYINVVDGSPFINLHLLAADQLREAGVGEIDSIDADTFTDERFYSVRREGPNTGRHLAVISL